MNVAFLASPLCARLWLMVLATLVAGTAPASAVAAFSYVAPQVVLTGTLAKRGFVGPPITEAPPPVTGQKRIGYSCSRNR